VLQRSRLHGRGGEGTRTGFV